LISLFAYANVVPITFVFLTYRLFTKFTENFVSRIVVAARVKRRRARTREMGIVDVDNFRFDMFFEGSGNVKVWVETKNYASSTGFTTSFYNQFKAYISNPELKNFDELRYFFRANPGVTKESQVLKFKNLINNGGNKEQFYQSLNQSLKEEYGIFSSSDITDSFLNNLLNTIVEVY